MLRRAVCFCRMPWPAAEPAGCRPVGGLSSRSTSRLPALPMKVKFMRAFSRPATRSGLLLLAAAAFASALYVHHRSRQAERAHPPPGKFVSVNGKLLHYVEQGQGEPLVLLHGNSSMHLDFLMSGLVQLAASRYRVIVFDRPGSGWSERPRGRTLKPERQAELLLLALEEIGVHRPILYGHSWGTLVALAMALKAPESLRALVLEAGYYYPNPRPAILFALPLALPGLGTLLRHTFAPLLLRMQWPFAVKLLFAPSKVPEHFWRFPPWMLLRPSQLRTSSSEVVHLLPAAARLRRRYSQLSVPLVLLAGRHDRIVQYRFHSARLASELPGCDCHLFDGAGHMLHHLIPELMMAAIDEAASKERR